ncbi:ABC transporter substrate-binding protein [Rhizobium sp. Leaf384]|uniref:TRAP transporter substrate-binding protein n=1 Tax=unclassified Rhizobium TaxID=2613769 RepID=UPI0007161DE1|nr:MULTISPECIES: TRAP transporter substrate-binding protein [unclassified Rhizobium]KQS77081.1 ABC transporter substrate-binding protein [Rhizobium sp. Leaf384]KQS78352.1 ABC transporter substrate-binding protein [Rhizobium sp. Leaf383]
MSIITRRSFLTSALAAGLAAPALVRPAFARTTSITVASLLGEDKPETRIWRHIAERVESRMPGRFRFNVVANGALGGEKDVAEATRLGAVQASLATTSSLSGWVPELQILDLPFLYRDAAHVARVVGGEIGVELQDRLKAQNFIATGFIDYGARHLLAKEPILRPQDMAGRKIRVIQSPLHTKLWSGFGAVPVGIPITETYNALSTGVVDAMDLTKSAYAGFKLYEVVPVMMLTGHIRASGVVYFAGSFWNGLSSEEQQVLTDASREGAGVFNDLIVADEAASVATARSHGGQVLDVPDLAAWRQGARGVWDAFAPVIGGQARIEAVEAL